MVWIIIYVLGIIATLCLLYHKLDKGYVVEVIEIVAATTLSLVSWGAFFTILLFMYGDKEVFKKK